MLELILGGARSGKSGYAQTCAIQNKQAVTLLATATAEDSEMAQRIELHKKQRPDNIEVIEEPLIIADVLAKQTGSDKSIILDCLTLWLSNLLLKHNEQLETSAEYIAFVKILDNYAMPGSKANLYIVSNEVGMGIIPMGHLNRVYVDAVGRLHQLIAAKAQRVTLMVAGLPHSIKSEINNDMV